MSTGMKGIITTDDLNDLHPLLNKWLKLIDDYCNYFCNDENSDENDNPWWYNERATLSSLAGAAWRLPGWIALEEFRTTKRSLSKVGNNNYGCRCDLYVGPRGDNDEVDDYAIEAKQCWIALSQPKEKIRKRIDRAHNAAKNDADNLVNDEAEKRLAATFIVPYVSNKYASKNSIKSIIQKWIKEWIDGRHLTKTIKAPFAIAYYFNTKYSFTSTNRRGNKYNYPGVVLLIEQPTRRG